MCEKALFDTPEALPADDAFFVRRGDEHVVMVHLAVAFHAADRGFVRNFRVNRFDHRSIVNGKW